MTQEAIRAAPAGRSPRLAPLSVHGPGHAPGRLHWMDAVRGFAVLLVIILHAGALYGVYHQEVPAFLRNAGLAMAPYRMPLLVFLSGFLLPKSKAKDDFGFLEGKFRNLAWPYVVWTVIACLASGAPERLLHYSVWVGGSYLWYILFVGFYFVVALVFRAFPYVLLSAIALTIALAMPDGSKYGERLFFLMSLFFAGALCGTHVELFLRSVKSRWYVWFFPFVLFLSIFSISSYPDQTINYSPEYAVPIIGSIYFISAFFFNFQDHAIFSPLKYIGQNSIVFYVMHIPVYELILRLRLPVFADYPALCIALLITAALSLSALAAYFRPRLGVLALLFAGPRLGFAR